MNAGLRNLGSSLKGNGEPWSDTAAMRTGLEVHQLDAGEIREETSRRAGTEVPEDQG